MTVTFDVVLNRFQENKVLQIAQTYFSLCIYYPSKENSPVFCIDFIEKKTYQMLVTVYLDTLVTKPLPHTEVILTIIVLLLSPKRLLDRSFLFP